MEKDQNYPKNDIEWIASYLQFNREITVWQAQVLRGMAESTLSARVSEMRRLGWDIECVSGVYILISAPPSKVPSDGCICIDVEVLEELSETFKFAAKMVDKYLGAP